MKTILKKMRTLLFLDLGWFFRFTRKRFWQRVGLFKTRMTGRQCVDVDIDGTRVKLSTLTPYHHSISQHLLHGRYEMEQLSQWLVLLPSKKVIYDVGGFNGIYGLVAALRSPEAQVVIFEPDAANAKEIRNSIGINQLSNCRVEEAAISDHTGRLFFSQGGSTGEHISTANEGKSVQAYALKDLPHADLMKIDIEGAEAMALRGMDYKATILLEVHPLFLPHFQDSVESLMQMISEKGYAVSEVGKGEEYQRHYLLTA